MALDDIIRPVEVWISKCSDGKGLTKQRRSAFPHFVTKAQKDMGAAIACLSQPLEVLKHGTRSGAHPCVIKFELYVKSAQSILKHLPEQIGDREALAGQLEKLRGELGSLKACLNEIKTSMPKTFAPLSMDCGQSAPIVPISDRVAGDPSVPNRAVGSTRGRITHTPQ
jgi:hypothetical protein